METPPPTHNCAAHPNCKNPVAEMEYNGLSIMIDSICCPSPPGGTPLTAAHWSWTHGCLGWAGLSWAGLGWLGWAGWAALCPDGQQDNSGQPSHILRGHSAFLPFLTTSFGESSVFTRNIVCH